MECAFAARPCASKRLDAPLCDSWNQPTAGGAAESPLQLVQLVEGGRGGLSRDGVQSAQTLLRHGFEDPVRAALFRHRLDPPHDHTLRVFKGKEALLFLF